MSAAIPLFFLYSGNILTKIKCVGGKLTALLKLVLLVRLPGQPCLPCDVVPDIIGNDI